MSVVSLGTAIGLADALMTGRFLRSFHCGVGPQMSGLGRLLRGLLADVVFDDLSVYLAAIGVIVCACAVAIAAPTRRLTYGSRSAEAKVTD